MNKTLLTLGTLLLMSSCAKEEFSTTKGSQSSSVSQALSYQSKICSQRTLVKPPVDILILWDNTASANHINATTKAAMGNLITSISDKFDYHVLNMPLVATTTSQPYINEGILVVRNPSDVQNIPLNVLKTDDSNSSGIQKAKNALSFNLSNNGTEQAAQRTFDIIKGNLDANTGVFRRNAYTITVVISNEDDKACPTDQYGCVPSLTENYKTTQINKLLCLRGNSGLSNCSSYGVSSNTLNASMFRFLNISPRTTCAMAPRTSSLYPEYSKRIYTAGYSNGTQSPTDQFHRANGLYDSYDICTTSYSNIFQSINSIISDVEVKHKYDYWPVAGSSQVIDESSIRVIRSDGKELIRQSSQSASEGFYYFNYLSRNTRYEPTPGEPFTGKMIRLLGDDRIAYPDCLTVYYEDAKHTYGYIFLTNGKPNESTISVRLSTNNGVSYSTIPKSTTNGWSYLGYRDLSSLNQSERVDQVPGGATAGYIIQLNGTYKPSNSTSIRFLVDYTSSN